MLRYRMSQHSFYFPAFVNGLRCCSLAWTPYTLSAIAHTAHIDLSPDCAVSRSAMRRDLPLAEMRGTGFGYRSDNAAVSHW